MSHLVTHIVYKRLDNEIVAYVHNNDEVVDILSSFPSEQASDSHMLSTVTNMVAKYFATGYYYISK